MSLSPEEQWEEKMRSLTKSVIKSGKLKTRRRVGKRVRKRDKLFNKVRGEWAENSCFIDNQKLIIQPLEDTGAKRVEVMLTSIKHVLPAGEDNTEFAITWVSTSLEDIADVINPTKAKAKEKEMNGDEFTFSMGVDMDDEEDDDDFNPVHRKDQVVVFKAASAEDARSWINALNRAIQVSGATGVTNSASLLREYSTLDGGNGAASALSTTSAPAPRTTRKKRRNLDKAEKMWTRANKEAKKLPPGVQTAGRTVGAIASTLSITMVGGFVKSLLKAVVAPGRIKRKALEVFQRIWVDAMIWLTPPMLFHVTGDIPYPVRPTRYSSRKSSKRGSKRGSKRLSEELVETPIRIFLMNSACESDIVLTMMLAKAVEDGHGRVKGFISYDERNKLFGLGTLFDLFGFLFLSRRSAQPKQDLDRKRIEKHLKRLDIDEADEWIVIYPERGWANSKRLSMQNRKKGAERPMLEQLLLPDANELQSCLEALGKREVQVYDMTLSFEGYSGELPSTAFNHNVRHIDRGLPSYKNILNGTASENIHIDSKVFSANEILGHQGGVQGWLDERWKRKDELLQHFAENQVFPPETDAAGNVRQDSFSVEGAMLPMLLVWLFNLLTISFIFVYMF